MPVSIRHLATASTSTSITFSIHDKRRHYRLSSPDCQLFKQIMLHIHLSRQYYLVCNQNISSVIMMGSITRRASFSGQLWYRGSSHSIPEFLAKSVRRQIHRNATARAACQAVSALVRHRPHCLYVCQNGLSNGLVLPASHAISSCVNARP